MAKQKAKAKEKPKENPKATKARKLDDPLKQYVILDPKTMKTPPGRWLFLPIDTDDMANRMCLSIALASYADALNVLGRKKQAMAVVAVAAEMVTDIKMKHPELFCKKERPNANDTRSCKARS